MNDKDVANSLHKLKDLHAELPLHQAKLRKQLLAVYVPQRSVSSRFRGAFAQLKKGASPMKISIKPLGLSVLTVSLLVAGVLVFTNLNSTSVAAQYLEKAAQQTQEMSPAEIARINELYQQDLQQRLEQAKKSDNLRVLSNEEVVQWMTVPKSDPAIKTVLGYTDNKGHRILIALTENNEPYFVYDADAPPTMVIDSESPAETKESETTKKKE